MLDSSRQDRRYDAMLPDAEAWARIRTRVGPAWDVVFSLLWLILAWLCFIGRYGGEYPFLSLDSDTAQIASFAAARIAPEHFGGDYLLANPRNYAFYSTVQIPLAMFVSRLVGDLGLAFILPLAALVAAQGIGCYCLALRVLESRFFASVFALSMLPVVRFVPLADYWGIRGYTTPRDWFQAFLPWLLLLVLTRAAQEPWRIAIMGLMGLMTYIHPVSVPGWALAAWASFWFFLPSEWAIAKRAKHMLLYGCVYLLVASLFIVRFVASDDLATPVPHQEVLDVMKLRFAAGYTDLGLAFRSLLAGAWQTGTLLLALVGVPGLFAFGERRDPRRMALAAWTGALLLVTCVAPVVDHSLAKLLDRLPVEIDLVRGVRYLFFIAWLAGLWGLALLARQGARYSFVAACTALIPLVVMLVRFPPSEFLEQGAKMASRGEILPTRARANERQSALNIVLQTPEQARFLASTTEDAMALRFYARRSVVYSYKDGGSFGYSNHAALLDWRRRQDTLTPIVGKGKLAGNVIPPGRLNDFARVAKEWGADHLFLAQPVSTTQLPRGARMLFAGKRYSVIAL